VGRTAEISDESALPRDRLGQIDTALGTSLTAVNDAKLVMESSGLFTTGGGIEAFLMRIVRAVFGALLWLVFIVANAVNTIRRISVA
jgi:hypothetical protein